MAPPTGGGGGGGGAASRSKDSLQPVDVGEVLAGCRPTRVNLITAPARATAAARKLSHRPAALDDVEPVGCPRRAREQQAEQDQQRAERRGGEQDQRPRGRAGLITPPASRNATTPLPTMRIQADRAREEEVEGVPAAAAPKPFEGDPDPLEERPEDQEPEAAADEQPIGRLELAEIHSTDGSPRLGPDGSLSDRRLASGERRMGRAAGCLVVEAAARAPRPHRRRVVRAPAPSACSRPAPATAATSCDVDARAPCDGGCSRPPPSR